VNQELSEMHNARTVLNRRAGTANRKRWEIEQQIADIEAANLGLAVGQVVEGYLHVGVRRPRWVKGVITGFHFTCDAPCATLEFPEPVTSRKRIAFYLTSIRTPEVKP